MKKNVSLAELTSFRIGGTADLVLTVEREEDFLLLPPTFFVLGGGTNVLFSDRGLRCPLVILQNKRFAIDDSGITAGAGLPMGVFLQKCAAAGWDFSDFDWPGSVGGAVYGNAGSRSAVGDYLQAGRVFDVLTGKMAVKKRAWFRFSYRHSRLMEEENRLLWEANFALPARREPEEILVQIREKALGRVEKNPAGFSAGSFFKNPPGDFAGRFLELAGCKGLVCGNAQISEKHANFIINLGGALQEDVLALARRARGLVLERFGVLLEPEVRIVDEFGEVVGL